MQRDRSDHDCPKILFGPKPGVGKTGKQGSGSGLGLGVVSFQQKILTNIIWLCVPAFL